MVVQISLQQHSFSSVQVKEYIYIHIDIVVLFNQIKDKEIEAVAVVNQIFLVM